MSRANLPGTVDQLNDLYRKTIVEHAVNPTGYGDDIEPTHRHEVFNPLCGDRIDIQLRIADHRIEAAAFEGEACAICMASASLLCAHQGQRSVSDLTEAYGWLRQALEDRQEEPLIEALRPLLGVRAYPSRVRCALLPWEAATQAIEKNP